MRFETGLEGFVMLLGKHWRQDVGYGSVGEPAWFRWGRMKGRYHPDERGKWYIKIALPSYSWTYAANSDHYCCHQLHLVFTAPLVGPYGENDGWRFMDFPL